MKVDGGRAIIKRKLTSMNRREVEGAAIVTGTLNRGRYEFYYDELGGDFSLKILGTLSGHRRSLGFLWRLHVSK